jgi:hypothetical protein
MISHKSGYIKRQRTAKKQKIQATACQNDRNELLAPELLHHCRGRQTRDIDAEQKMLKNQVLVS